MMTNWLHLPLHLTEVCWIVTLSLAHSLWQCVSIWICYQLLKRAVVLPSQQARFNVAFSVLVTMGGFPVANAIYFSSFKGSSVQCTTAVVATTQSLELVPLPQVVQRSEMQVQKSVKQASAIPASALDEHLDRGHLRAGVVGSVPEASGQESNAFAMWPFCISAAYAVGISFMLAKLLVGLINCGRLGRRCSHHEGQHEGSYQISELGRLAARQFGLAVYPPIVLYRGPGTAMLIGVFRPVVLFNGALASGLTPSQIEQVLAHELAHFYRLDHITLIIQKVVESFLFFHPIVWLLSREIYVLRELACDELVVRSYSRLEYANTLLHCAEGTFSTSPASLGLGGQGGANVKSRVEWLLAAESQSSHAREGAHRSSRYLAMLAVLLLAAAAVAPRLSHKFVPLAFTTAMPADDDQIQTGQAEKRQDKKQPRPAWPWQDVPSELITRRSLMFGGQRLTLERELPHDLTVSVDVPREQRFYTQWQFGDFESTSVAVLVVKEAGKIHDIYLDRNRDRRIDAGDKLSGMEDAIGAWLTTLTVEVCEADGKVHSPRPIAITQTAAGDCLRITTLGFAQGIVDVDGESIAVRRFDMDGNGVPADFRDRIALDLDGDGTFDPLSEVFPVHPVLEIAGNRYSAMSDRLGQALSLVSDSEHGLVRFEFELDDPSAILESLEGSIRDENGNLVGIRSDEMQFEIPTGHYTIDHLVVQVRDAKGAVWRMTLAGGSNQSWFQVRPEEQQSVQLLDGLHFRVAQDVGPGANGDKEVRLEPELSTSRGLVVTNFTCVSSEGADNWTDSLIATFTLLHGETLPEETAFDRPAQCSSSFG